MLQVQLLTEIIVVYILRVGGKCAMQGILELWLFNKMKLQENLTDEKILRKVEARPTFRFESFCERKTVFPCEYQKQ